MDTLTSLSLPSELESYRLEIEKTLLSYYQIKITPNKTNYQQSKLGGYPYFPKNSDYPKNSKGECLRLLVQLNFSEIPSLSNFPTKGILQIYLDSDHEIYGLNLDNPCNQEYFRVLYFPDIEENENNLITDFDFLSNIFANFHLFPIIGEYSLDFIPQVAPISPSDESFDQVIPSNDTNDHLIELYWQFYDQNYTTLQHKLGGYPDFIQCDPRVGILADVADPYILLLQINSEYFNENHDICWGDAGIANFFIRVSDLKNLDFSHVLYNWDCS